MSTTGSVIRVIIVDDSIRYRSIIKKILEKHDMIIVVGEAVNGIEALELILRFKPDVIIMDLEMPLMDGMTALQHLMIHVPTPTLMFSKLTMEGTARCFDALKHGAVDFFCKDSLHLTEPVEEVEQQIIEKVICASKVMVKAVEPVFPKVSAGDDKKLFIKALVFCEECGSKEEITIRENEDQGGVICSQCNEFISLEQRNKYRRANFVSIILAGEGSFINLLKLIPALRQDMNGALLVLIDGNVDHVDEFCKYLDNISTMNVVRVKEDISLQGGNCYIGGATEGIFIKPFSANYTLKTRGLGSSDDLSVDGTIRTVTNVFKEKSAAIFLSGKIKQGDKGTRELLKNKGNTVVLEPERCIHKEMGLNIIRLFGASTVYDEIELARYISKSHLQYRDTIITA